MAFKDILALNRSIFYACLCYAIVTGIFLSFIMIWSILGDRLMDREENLWQLKSR